VLLRGCEQDGEDSGHNADVDVCECGEEEEDLHDDVHSGRVEEDMEEDIRREVQSCMSERAVHLQISLLDLEAALLQQPAYSLHDYLREASLDVTKDNMVIHDEENAMA